MNFKIFFGYIFIVLAALLSLIFFGNLYKLFITIIGLVELFTGNPTSYQIGRIVGELSVWAFIIFVIFVLWKYGFKWIKKSTEI